MISGLAAPGTDPYALNRAIEAVVRKHGASFLDASPKFQGVRDVASYYYPVDGHLNAKGNALLADVVQQGLVAGPRPLVAGCDKNLSPGIQSSATEAGLTPPG